MWLKYFGLCFCLYRRLYLKLFLSRHLFNFDKLCSWFELLDALWDLEKPSVRYTFYHEVAFQNSTRQLHLFFFTLYCLSVWSVGQVHDISTTLHNSMSPVHQTWHTQIADSIYCIAMSDTSLINSMWSYNCPVHNWKKHTFWCYITMFFLLLVYRCWFSVSPFGRFISGTHWIVVPGKRSRYNDSLRTGRSGDLILVCSRFSAPFQTGSAAHPASYTVGTESFRG